MSTPSEKLLDEVVKGARGGSTFVQKRMDAMIQDRQNEITKGDPFAEEESVLKSKTTWKKSLLQRLNLVE